MDSQKRKITILTIALVISLICTGTMAYMLFIQKDEEIVQVPEWSAEVLSEEEAEATGYNPEFMQMAIDCAINSSGGPIGAVIVKDGEVIVATSNQSKTPGMKFMHAEMCAIRDACLALGTNSLEGCVLYTSAQPCLMCESTIAGRGIEKVYYAATLQDMEDLGYDDLEEYEKIHDGKNLVESYGVDVENKLAPFENRKKK